ncbi:MAG: methyltransferase [Chitinophagales bacterium]|nr:methyltransferase [Chitinophagales bacterium]
MSNTYFRFKHFIVHQGRCAMKVTTDGCLFGAWVADKVQHLGTGLKILDIGTGTGLLSLMLAQKNPTAEIEAKEIDKEAATQATENVNASPWKEQISVMHTDAKLYSTNKNYGLIISNPPFYEDELKSHDDSKNIAHHSSALTLDGLLGIIKKSLSENGNFYLLLPYKRLEEIPALFTKHSLQIKEKTLVRQTTKHDYFRVMLAGSHQGNLDNKYPELEISIKDEAQQYTAEFTALLKEYYLQL